MFFQFESPSIIKLPQIKTLLILINYKLCVNVYKMYYLNEKV
jgi:hypothetical protein